MIKIENIEVVGIEHAIRGARNPMNSWKQSDTITMDFLNVGPKDMDLMQRLCAAGTDHRKFMRMITVYMDITAPLYWWKEFDTYKVGTVANSCSTMHKITERPLEQDDFSVDDWELSSIDILHMNYLMHRYKETNDKKYWRALIQNLTSSYNQKRTVMLNYEVALNMYTNRKNHKLDEWHGLCDEIISLPYFAQIIKKEGTNE